MDDLVKMAFLFVVATAVSKATAFVVGVTSHEDTILHHTYANYSGDLLIVGFFPIHQNLVSSESGNECGGVQEQDGIQALEMFLYTLDEVNNRGFLPNFTLGAVAFDSCDDELYALQQGVDVVAVLMSRTGYNRNSYICWDGSKPNVSPLARDLHKVFSVVGGSSSAVTLNLASFFTLFNIPQISYLATTTDLSNKDRYPHFKRTVPSDSVQSRAIITLLKSFNWTYVSVIYEDTNYGIKGFAELEKWAEEDGVCFASTDRIDFNDPRWMDSDYDNIIQNILEKEEARVVVLYVDYLRAKKIFEAAERNNITDQLTWVGSDAWSGRSAAVEGYDNIADGAITLQPYAYINPDFDEYFKGLNIRSNDRNPWFDEFWESHFNCKLDEDLQTIPKCDAAQCQNPKYADIMQTKALKIAMLDKICTGNEIIGEHSKYYQQNYLHFISDAVLAYAYALKDFHRDICGLGYEGLCLEMSAVNLTGGLFTSYLDNLTFTASSGLDFKFFNGMDGPPRYTIMNYVYDESTKAGIWKEVGNYSGQYSEDGVTGEHQLKLDEAFVKSMENTTTSVCSLPCEIGQARQFVQPYDLCCWVCITCNEDEIVRTSVIGDLCRACDYGFYPNVDRYICEAIPETFLYYKDGAAIGAMIFATVGVLGTIFTFSVFIVYGSTPVVKASGRELSFYLLAAITLAFSSTFLIVHKPTPVVCGSTRVLVGLCFAMIYASILTKTNRISRIFNGGGQKGRRAKYTSPKSQIIIVNILVFVEALVLTAWLIASPPGISHVYPDRLANVLVCAGEEGAIYLVGLIYPAILLFCCAVYAFRTRKTPDGFNETKHVGIVSYTTVIILLALIPVFFMTDDPGIKTIAICFTLSLTAAVVLCCIFVPKIYICLFRPNKNTKDAIMQRTTSVLSSVSVNSRDHSNSRAASCSLCGKDNTTTRDTKDYNAVVLNPEQLDEKSEITDKKSRSNDNVKEMNIKNDDNTKNNGNGVITSEKDINRIDEDSVTMVTEDQTQENGEIKPTNKSRGSDDAAPRKKRHSTSSVSFANDVDIISESDSGSYKDAASTPPESSTPIKKDEQSDVIIRPGSKTHTDVKKIQLQKALDNFFYDDSGIAEEPVDVMINDAETDMEQDGHVKNESVT